MSDLLITLVRTAVTDVLHSGYSAVREHSLALPLPMVLNNYEPAAGTCVLQEDLASVVVNASGFAYAAQAPERKEQGAQKWAWLSDTPGDRIDLKINTTLPARDNKTLAQLDFIFTRSFRNVGVVRVSCVSFCSCKSRLLNLVWPHRVTLADIISHNVRRGPGGIYFIKLAWQLISCSTCAGLPT